jgi:peptidoglycan/LPS O-acetylase OafA/YrhL
MSGARLKYEPSLDGLRGVAVALVALFHAGAPGFQGGQQGVDVFFVLSGFLITSMLSDGIGYVDFWTRRFLRLTPALIVLCVAYLVAAPRIGQPISEGWLALAYVRNLPLAASGPMGMLMHTWSLAIEAQFYLLWPLLLPLIVRTGRPFLILAGFWLIVTTLRTVYLATGGAVSGAYYSTFLHSSGLLLGAALVFAPRLSGRWAWVGASLLMGYLVVAGWGRGGMAAGLPLVEVATALLIASPSRLNAILSWRPLVGLGEVSYGFYLWHFPVHAIWQLSPWWAQLAGMVGFALPMAILSFMTVERLRRLPALRRRPQGPILVQPQT